MRACCHTPMKDKEKTDRTKDNLTMKELPDSERPYEKCRAAGPAYLSDAELLAVILRSGTCGQTALELAQKLLARRGEKNGLAAVVRLTLGELTRIPGIGPVKAVQLQCIGELARRIAKASAREEIRLDRPEAIARYFMEDLRYKKQEEMVVAMFDTKGHLLRETVISRGTVNASLVTPREVFLEAMRQEAVYVVLVHNHPSGDPTPSREDIRLTKRMQEAGDLLEIPVLDHIIIGDNRYLSFKERGYIS